MNSANDNTRPAEFDRQLALAYPRLLKRAARFSGEPAVLANQAMLLALTRWQTFRQTPGNPYHGFYTWLCWVMMGGASDTRRKISRRIVTVSSDAMPDLPVRAVRASQEAATDLPRVLAVLRPREREVLLRRAAGDKLIEIGEDMGVTRERVRQIEEGARAKVLALVAANDNGRPC